MGLSVPTTSDEDTDALPEVFAPLAHHPAVQARKRLGDSSIDHARQLALVNRVLAAATMFRLTGAADSLLLYGHTFAGKTEIARMALLAMPRRRDAIRIMMPDGSGERICDDVPILYVKLLATPSRLTLLDLMLQMIGDPFWHRGNETKKFSRLVTYLKAARTALIIVDESNHLVDRGGTTVLEATADSLKIIHDATNIPQVLIGIPSTIFIYLQNAQVQARSVELPYRPYDWEDTAEGGERDQFRQLLEAVFEVVGLPMAVSVTDEHMAARLHYAAGGYGGRLVKLVRTLLDDMLAWAVAPSGPAIYSPQGCTITVEGLAKAFEKAAWRQLSPTTVLDPFAKGFVWSPPPSAHSNLFSELQLPRKSKKRYKAEVLEKLTKG